MATSKNTSSTEQSRIEGAEACMRALAEMVKSAEAFNDDADKPTCTETAAHYFGSRLHGAKAIADAIGPLTPYQEGAIIALAEYIHSFITTGEPNLEQWRPCAAMTADEYRGKVEGMARDIGDMYLEEVIA